MNDAIQRFVDELAADPTVRGILLFGSHARGNARPDSDADLAIFVERDGFEMAFADRDGQEFELVRLSEAVAVRYFTDNRDHAADVWQVAEILYDPDGAAGRVRDHVLRLLAEGKPPMDEARRGWSRWSAEDRLDAAAGLAQNEPAHRDVRGRRVVRGPAGARPADAPPDLRRRDHLIAVLSWVRGGQASA